MKAIFVSSQWVAGPGSNHPCPSRFRHLALAFLTMLLFTQRAMAEHGDGSGGEMEASSGSENATGGSLPGVNKEGGEGGDGCENLKDRPQEGPMACWATASAVIKDFHRGDGKMTHETEMSKLVRNGETKRQTTGGNPAAMMKILRRSGLRPKRSSLGNLTKPGTVAIIEYDNGAGGSHAIAVCVQKDGKLRVADSQDPEHGSSTNTAMSVAEISSKKGPVKTVLEVTQKRGLLSALGL